MWSKLKRLSETGAPSGYETSASDIASEFLEPLVSEVKRDALGNVLGFMPCGKPDAPLLALDAHLDEIGFMVAGHKDGFLQFRMIGGLDQRILPATGIRLLTEPVIRGLVSWLPPHVQKKSDFEKSVPPEELYIDVGLTQAEAERLVPVGTVGVFDTPFNDLGASVMGKALDDRAGFIMLLRTLELLRGTDRNIDIVVCGVVQEEVGLRGAITAAYGQAPDMCIAVDVTHAHTPDASKDRTYTAGGGVCIGVGPCAARFISDGLIDTAKTNNIPYQLEISGGGSSTDAEAYQISREGIPTGLLSLPLKYMHTPSEMLCKDDLENGARLLAAFIGGVNK